MNDVTTLLERYIAVWNETDSARRRDLIGQTWSEDATYVDPLFSVAGEDGINGMVAALHQQLPGHRFRLSSTPDSHHDVVRFAWELCGPEAGEPTFAGTDVGIIAPDGRLASVTGFLDRVPEGFGS